MKNLWRPPRKGADGGSWIDTNAKVDNGARRDNIQDRKYKDLTLRFDEATDSMVGAPVRPIRQQQPR